MKILRYLFDACLMHTKWSVILTVGIYLLIKESRFQTIVDHTNESNISHPLGMGYRKPSKFLVRNVKHK